MGIGYLSLVNTEILDSELDSNIDVFTNRVYRIRYILHSFQTWNQNWFGSGDIEREVGVMSLVI